MKKPRNRLSLDLARGTTLDVSACYSKLEGSPQKLPHVEFYKTNIGPGAYDPLKEARTPKFSFGKDGKLKQEPSVAPGVGSYSPTHVKKKAPACIIGKSSKWDEYWEKRMVGRSPGPIYGYTLDSDSANKSQLNRVVIILPHVPNQQIARAETWKKCPKNFRTGRSQSQSFSRKIPSEVHI